MDREIRELNEALDAQLKQCDGLNKSIESKTAAINKTVATIEKKAIETKKQVHHLICVKESIDNKINRLKALNVDRSSDCLQAIEEDTLMGVNYILSDGRADVVNIDVDRNVLFNSDLAEVIAPFNKHHSR